MIKIERILTDKAQKAIKSLKEAKSKGTSCNTEAVNSALQELFHGKCYICENNKITSYQIEHLIPHKENPELKYDWNNLFLSCAHCNNIKGDKITPIIDCTKENVEEKLAFRKTGFFGTEEKLVFEMLDESVETQNTKKLLELAFYGNTPQKKMEAKIMRKELRKELSNFKEYVREYMEAENADEKEDVECLIKKELSDRSSFTAFKRWLIRDNADTYSELMKHIS